MRITSMKYKDGSKPTESELEALCEVIVATLERAGFITDGQRLSSSAIKIGMRMRSFRVDVAKLGYNARFGVNVGSLKGYRRTAVPTWGQRVKFNEIVNDVLDQWKIVANARSGPFTVRDARNGRHKEENWIAQEPGYSYKGVLRNAIGEVLCEIRQEAEVLKK